MVLGKARKTKTHTRETGGLSLRSIGRTFKRGTDWVKKNKAISKTLGVLGFEKGSNIAANLGYGEKGGFSVKKLFKPIKRTHAWIKDKKVVSKALEVIGNKKGAQIARDLGYGKRRVGGRSRYIAV